MIFFLKKGWLVLARTTGSFLGIGPVQSLKSFTDFGLKLDPAGFRTNLAGVHVYCELYVHAWGNQLPCLECLSLYQFSCLLAWSEYFMILI